MTGPRTVDDVIAEWEHVEPHLMGVPGSSGRRTCDGILLLIAEIRSLRGGLAAQADLIAEALATFPADGQCDQHHYSRLIGAVGRYRRLDTIAPGGSDERR